MCGRFAFWTPVRAIIQEFNITKTEADIRPSYNIAPAQKVPVIVQQEGEIVLDSYRWGLIPSWAKDPKTGYKMINTRIESIEEKPMFKRTIEKQRCMIVANGFYEWKPAGKEGKIPQFIQVKGREAFAFAGIYDEWKSPDGRAIKTCSIITKQPNAFMSKIHDRMPAILAKGSEERWLDYGEDRGELVKMLKSDAGVELIGHPVSDFVNSPRNNTVECVRAV